MPSQPVQSGTPSPESSSRPASAQITAQYHRPTEKEKFHNYVFDAFGPYPIIGAAIAGGINQADNSPPEWGGGSRGYAQRFGSNFGIALITTTSRYTMAAAFREDTIYYRCSCSGFFPRLEHALISTVTARRGEDGHRTISMAAIASPYIGTEAAVYGWYPGRFDSMDGFRMGNYNLAVYAASNVALEFIYGGPHTLLSHVHLGHSDTP
jgi:hypothetical protein